MDTRVLGLIAVLGVLAAPSALHAHEIHFSPEERLDAIDAELIAGAKRSIDFASYALTDPVVILDAAQRRGVAVRIVLDPRERHDFAKLGDLSDTVRIKRGGAYMHLKAYAMTARCCERAPPISARAARMRRTTIWSSFETRLLRPSSTRTLSACGMTLSP
jgi:hypothetical protein